MTGVDVDMMALVQSRNILHVTAAYMCGAVQREGSMEMRSFLVGLVMVLLIEVGCEFLRRYYDRLLSRSALVGSPRTGDVACGAVALVLGVATGVVLLPGHIVPTILYAGLAAQEHLPPISWGRKARAEIMTAGKATLLVLRLSYSIQNPGTFDLRLFVIIAVPCTLIYFASILADERPNKLYIWQAGRKTMVTRVSDTALLKAINYALAVGYLFALLTADYGNRHHVNALIAIELTAIPAVWFRTTYPISTRLRNMGLICLWAVTASAVLSTNPIDVAPAIFASLLLAWHVLALPGLQTVRRASIPRANGGLGDEVTISGGGVGGLALGACLEQMGIPYVILERRSRDEMPNGADLALWPSAVTTLKQLGVNPKLWDETQPISTMRMCRADDDSLIKLVNMEAVVEDEEEGFVLIPRRPLLESLQALVPDEKIKYDTSLQSVAVDGRHLTLHLNQGGQDVTTSASLLVGADGLRSATRQFVAPTAAVTFRGEICYRGVVDVDALKETDFGALYAKTRPEQMQLVFAPSIRYSFGFLSEGQKRGFWFVKQHSRKPVQETTPAEQAEHVASWPQVLQDLYASTPAESSYLHSIVDADALDYWSRGPAVLLGDAAHPVTPNSAQGACMAIDDALVLAVALRQHALSPDGYVRAFYQYEMKRKPFSNAVLAEARLQLKIAHLGKIFGPEVPIAALKAAPPNVIEKRLSATTRLAQLEDVREKFRAFRKEERPLLY